jgi:ribosomal protein L44E
MPGSDRPVLIPGCSSARTSKVERQKAVWKMKVNGIARRRERAKRGERKLRALIPALAAEIGKEGGLAQPCARCLQESEHPVGRIEGVRQPTRIGTDLGS